MSPGGWESAGGGIRRGRVDSLLWGPAAHPPCAKFIAGCRGEPPVAPPWCTAPAPSCSDHAAPRCSQSKHPALDVFWDSQQTRLRPLQSPALFLKGKSRSVHRDEPSPVVPWPAQGWRMQARAGGAWRPLTLLQAQDASARDGQSWHP